MTRVLRLGLVLGLLAGLAAAGAGAAALGADGSGDLLPDLAAGAPGEIQVRAVAEGDRTRFKLSFESTAENVGEGELRIRAHRAGEGVEAMTADQVIRKRDGTARVVRGVGELRYVVDPTHQHWHLDEAMSYELVRLDGRRVLRRPDEKTGFCLGDRYEVAGFEHDAKPAAARYDVNCGYDAPQLLAVVEGISVGWGDNYEPWRDGQQIDVTGLPAGRYLLVHRVNAKRRLVERRFGNNGASAVLDLTWPRGRQARPDVRVLTSCRGTLRCAA